MQKGVVYGDDFELAEIMASYKDVFDFLPLLHFWESVDSKVEVTSLSKNIDITKVKAANITELAKHFEVAAAIGSTSKVFKNVKKGFIKYESDFYNEPKKIAKIKFTEDSKPINIRHFVCKVVRRLRSFGYCVAIRTNITYLKDMVQTMKQDKEPDILIDFCQKASNAVKYYIDENNLDVAVHSLSERLLVYLRIAVSKSEWVKRDCDAFRYQGDYGNIHLFVYDKKTYMFRTCNRSTSQVRGSFIKIWQEYLANNNESIAKYEYSDLYAFSEARYYERIKAKEFETLFRLPYLRIENINDVILSYLGARKCNLACEYCFSDHKTQEAPPLSNNQVIKIANYVVGGNRDVNLHFDNYIGGEPCLEFDDVKNMYYTLFQYHKTYGITASFGFLTNGTELTNEQLEWLRENVPYVGFSLDGDKTTNDAIRHNHAGKGSYESVINAIKKMQEMKWPIDIGVSCVLTANNLNIKDIFLHFVDDLGIKNIVIKPVRAPETSKYALTMKNILEVRAGYRDLFDFVYEKGKEGDLSYLKAMLMPLDYAGRFFIRTYLEDRIVVKRCGSGEHIFSVGNNASIYACDSFNGTSKGFLADTTNGTVSTDYKVPFVTQEHFGCETCWARYLCGGVCQYVQYINDYKRNSVTAFECELAKFLIEEAIRFWTKAREEYSKEALEEIEKHIKTIGFSRYKERDSFYYAPC